jgi:DNA-binding CsgD family transcriptional regulator
MKLDWERDVRPLAEEEGRNICWNFWDRESLAADLLSVSWEVMQGGREFDSPQHVLSIAKLRIKRLVHLDCGHPRSVDGRPMNGEKRPRPREACLIDNVAKRQTAATPESDGRLAKWLAALTPRQAQLCRMLVAGFTLYRVAKEWRVSRQSVRITRNRAGGRLRKLGVA